MERCLNCQFFDRRNARAKDGKTTQWGQCRRAAPMLSPQATKPHMIEGVWPHVRDDDWCGEFKGLAQRLDAQLTDLMNDPLMSPLAGESPVRPLFIPIGSPVEPGAGGSDD